MSTQPITPGADRDGMAPGAGASPAAGSPATAGPQAQAQLAAQNEREAQERMGAARDAVTQIARQIQVVGQQFQEMAPAAAQALKALQQGLTLVAGNPTRTPERQAPPNVV